MKFGVAEFPAKHRQIWACRQTREHAPAPHPSAAVGGPQKRMARSNFDTEPWSESDAKGAGGTPRVAATPPMSAALVEL
eukprot:13405928-Alexandrium_andersonii.AAC.1